MIKQLKVVVGKMYNVAIELDNSMSLICIGKPFGGRIRLMRNDGQYIDVNIEGCDIGEEKIFICERKHIVKIATAKNTKYNYYKKGTTPKVGMLYGMRERKDLGGCVCVRTYADCSCDLIQMTTGVKKRVYDAYEGHDGFLDIIKSKGVL